MSTPATERRRAMICCVVFAVASLGCSGIASAQTAWTNFPVMGRRAVHAMAYDSVRGRVFLMGGNTELGYASDLWTWDGLRWTHQHARTLPSPREGFGLAFDSRRDRLVLFGGAGPDTQTWWLGDTWEWDGSDWRLLAPPQSPTARWGGEMVYDVARQRVVMFGGYTSSGLSTETWEWDGTIWRRGPASAVPPRLGHSMAYDSARGLTVLVGGGDFAMNFFGDTWEYDGSSWMLRATAQAPPPSAGQAMVFDAARNETVLLSALRGQTTGETWTWNGQVWTRRVPTTSPPSVSYSSGAFDAARGRVVISGGAFTAGGGSWASADTWEWDGVTWRRAGTAVDPVARRLTDAAFDGRGVLLFGGVSPSGSPVNDTWRWNGAAWDRLPTSLAPARFDHRLVYDAGRGRVVLFGGSQGISLQNDTWEWDGATWQLRNLPSAPSPRSEHCLAYDSHRRRVVLFSGSNLLDTWEYDGTAWIQIPVPGPPPRVGGGMVYDPIRRRTVLFGGGFRNSSFSVTPYADMWEWDGIRWTARTPARSPAARHGHRLVWDAARNRIVLAGGWRGGFQRYTDAWEWDGQSWTERMQSSAPVDASSPALAYDPLLERVVFFTGRETGDTWTYAPRHPAQFALHYPSCGRGGRLSADDARPWLAEPFTLRLKEIPTNSTALLLLGFSPTLLFGQIPLPLDLSSLGLTGCTLYTDIAAALPMVSAAGEATLTLPIPASASLAGGAFYVQGLFSDLIANPAGLLTTNAGAGVIGGK